MSDYIVRATAADSQIRAFAATTRDMVEYARNAHNTSPVATAALGRLMTAGAMMGSMMKGEDDVLTLQIKAGGPLKGITVTADSHGNVKGYVGNPNVVIPANAKGKLDDERMASLKKTGKRIQEIDARLEENAAEREVLEGELNKKDNGRIIAENIVYPGVKMTISNVSNTIKSEVQHSAFVRDGADIRIRAI